MFEKVQEFLKNPRNLLVLVVLVLLAVYLCYTCLLKNKTSVETENFSTNDVIVRIFHVKWCGHCKAAKSEFETFYNERNNTNLNGKNVKVEMIDADDEPDKASQYGVTGYPTIKGFANGNSVNYPDDYQRSNTDLSKFLTELCDQ